MQFPPYTVLQEPFEKKKKTGSKGILTCWLILPFLLFLLGLIFFLILICKYIPSNSSIDHAISVTKQLGEDVQAPIWNGLASKNVDCTNTDSIPLIAKGWPFAEFQGVDSGFITQVVRNQEYYEAEESESDSKVEKGIPFKKLNKVYQEYHLCVKTLKLDEYSVKKDGVACATGFVPCDGPKVCAKGANPNIVCPYTSLKKTNTNANFFNDKKVEGLINGADKQFVIGMRGGFARPCKNPDYLDEKPSKTDYPLYGIRNSGCDEYGSYAQTQAVELFGDINYKLLLDYNVIDHAHYESPYFYDYIANKDANVYKIYTIHRPKLVEDSKCMNDNKGFAKLPTVRQYVGETNRPLFVYFIMGLVFSAVGIFLWFALIAKSKSSQKQSGLGEQLFKVVHLMAVVLAILLIVIFIHYMSEFKGKKDDLITVKNSFKTAKDINCYQDAADWNTAFDKVYEFVHNALAVDYPLIITLFIFGVVYLVLTLIVFALIKTKKITAFSTPYSKK